MRKSLTHAGITVSEMAEYLDVTRQSVGGWINERGGQDILTVSRLLGHASVATTQRYVATDAARLRRVADAAA